MNALQKAAAQAIVNIFETGCVRGDYGNVTLLEGDTGRLTYGRSQTTIASGNLFKLIRDYIGEPGAAYAAAFLPYLPELKAKAPELDRDATFRALLEKAGADPVMQRVQDRFFDRVYWRPAVRAARRRNIAEPLGVAVVYDSHIHGSWGRVRRLTDEALGDAAESADEQTWIERYVAVRRAWLASRRNRLLRKTVYRMDAFQQLIDENQWALALPFEVRGVRISASSLGFNEARPVASASPATSAPGPEAANTRRP